MSRLLHVSASPRGDASVSRQLADAFLDELARAAPEVEVQTWDLWDGALPQFGPTAAAAKMAVIDGREPTGAEAAAWRDATAAFARFDSADLYLFSVPMWNMTVPYILKQFIDVVSQPGRLFRFDPQTGYRGLLSGKRAAALYTSAVWGPGRPPQFGADHLKPYFESWLRWAGVTDVSSYGLQPNLATVDPAAALRTALADVRELASRFAAPNSGGVQP